jgi:hypothetical protein
MGATSAIEKMRSHMSALVEGYVGHLRFNTPCLPHIKDRDSSVALVAPMAIG